MPSKIFHVRGALELLIGSIIDLLKKDIEVSISEEVNSIAQRVGFEVPRAWDQLYETAKALTKDGIYGLSFPTGTNDFQATFFLNFYVRSGGESLLTDDLRANLTSPLAIDGIKYWLKVYEDCSPKDTLNFDVLDQATLCYQGKTAFDFNSGFQISGIASNSPDLLQYVDCYPIPKIKETDPDEETAAKSAEDQLNTLFDTKGGNILKTKTYTRWLFVLPSIVIAFS